MKQIIVCPNQQIGASTINYIVELYSVDYVLSGGCKAANGWHVAPTIKTKTAKRPYRVEIVSSSALERYLAAVANKDDIIERW